MRSPPLRTWSIVGAVALLAAALLITAWTTYTAVQSASATLVRGQAGAYQQAIRWQLRRAGGQITSADLDAILEDGESSGLRHVALVDRRGDVAAQAGSSLFPGPPPPRLHDEPVILGDRVRVVLPAFPPRRGHQGGPPPLVVIEFEPVQAASLRAAALRTLGAGALAATMMLVVAVWLVRAVLRRDAIERQLERDRRLSSLGEMSAVLAHEIRNPLASLKGNAQLLAESLRGDERERKAGRVVEEASRLERLTVDLLAYVRGGAEPTAVDPGELLRICAAEVDPAIAVDTSRAPQRFPLDAPRARQMLLNLLHNAVLAGPPVLASAWSERGDLVLEVRDRGPGVQEAERARIFEPFFTRRTQGTGLGLAVVRRVVEDHRGAITVEDAPGGGAVFRVRLPGGP